MFAPYLDRNLKIDIDVRLRTKPYDKLDHYNFPIVHLPFIHVCSNIPAVWSIYLSVGPTFQNLCFLSGFHERG
jgi:hypothetical protein